jgi:hypothetical protein
MGNTTHSSSNEETIGPFGLIWSMRPSAQGTLAAVFLHTTCRKGFLTKCYKKNKNKNKKTSQSQRERVIQFHSSITIMHAKI